MTEKQNETNETKYEQVVVETIAALLYETHATATHTDILLAAHNTPRISGRLLQKGRDEYRQMVDKPKHD